MNNLNRITFFILVAILGFGCSSGETCGYIPDNYSPSVDISIERLDSDILQMNSREKILDFINKEPVVTEYFLLKNQYPNDSIFIDEMINRFSNPHIDSLSNELKRIFPDLSELESELEEAFSLLRYYYPDTKIPKVKAVATGFDYDLMVTDTLIIIGLDFYLGPTSKYRPRNTYNYILKRYEPKYIVPSIMLLYGISGRYNAYDTEDQSILSDMISYGKSFYFTKRMMPCTPDSLLIWYSQEEFNGAMEHEGFIWAHFLKENLLWETSHILKRTYLDERPKTIEISQECPPRIGTWLGWQIVQHFMENNPNYSLEDLMKISDAKLIFDKSAYRPE